jgi:glucose/mannose-6-phosphate isomerase
MDLNNHAAFPTVDGQNYLAEIENLPTQLESAYQQGLTFSLPAWKGIQRVLIAGMGGSAIGADAGGLRQPDQPGAHLSSVQPARLSSRT